MASGGRIGLQGGKEVLRRMRLLTREAQTKVARRSSNAGAQVIKKLAVANVIASPSVDEGDLRDNIIVKRVPESDLTSEHIVTVRTKRAGGAPHAALVEFGTVKMPAEPFMRPAFEGGKQEAANAMVNEAARGIDAAAKKAAKA